VVRGAWCVGVLAAGVGLAAGCTRLGGVRPRLEPFPSDSALSLATPAPDVIRAVVAELVSTGVPVLIVTPVEGYVESRWYDVERHAAGKAGRRLAHTVKLRFYADPVAGRTRLVAECAWQVIVDPSRPPRELERPVPAGHPGRALLDSVVARTMRRLGEHADSTAHTVP